MPGIESELLLQRKLHRQPHAHLHGLALVGCWHPSLLFIKCSKCGFIAAIAYALLHFNVYGIALLVYYKFYHYFTAHFIFNGCSGVLHSAGNLAVENIHASLKHGATLGWHLALNTQKWPIFCCIIIKQVIV
jgi:hypothetical protein